MLYYMPPRVWYLIDEEDIPQNIFSGSKNVIK